MTRLRLVLLAVLLTIMSLGLTFVSKLQCAVEEHDSLTVGYSYRPVRGQSPESDGEAHQSRKWNHPNRTPRARRGSSPSPFSRRAPILSRPALRDSRQPGKPGSSSPREIR